MFAAAFAMMCACLQPAFTSNDNCTDAAVTCPAQSGAVLSEDGQLEGIAKSDAAGIVDVCCAPLPVRILPISS
jgi:hypothetical protein